MPQRALAQHASNKAIHKLTSETQAFCSADMGTQASRRELQDGRQAARAWEGQQRQRIRQHGCHVTLPCHQQ